MIKHMLLSLYCYLYTLVPVQVGSSSSNADAGTVAMLFMNFCLNKK